MFTYLAAWLLLAWALTEASVISRGYLQINFFSPLLISGILCCLRPACYMYRPVIYLRKKSASQRPPELKLRQIQRDTETSCEPSSGRHSVLPACSVLPLEYWECSAGSVVLGMSKLSKMSKMLMLMMSMMSKVVECRLELWERGCLRGCLAKKPYLGPSGFKPQRY